MGGAGREGLGGRSRGEEVGLNSNIYIGYIRTILSGLVRELSLLYV